MPVILWPRHPYAKWLLTGFMLLWIGVLWLMSQDGRTWGAQVYPFLFPLQIYSSFVNLRYVLTGDTLAVVRGAVVQRIPLALAQLQRDDTRLRLRWPDGRRMRALKLKAPAPFADAIEQAALSAHGSAPAAEAAPVNSFGFFVSRNAGLWGTAALVALLAVFGLAIWQNQPLFLLPLALLPMLAERADMGRLLMMRGDVLWLLTPEEAPRPIPLAAVQDVVAQRTTALIATSDPAYPEIHLNRYQSRELLKQLQHRRPGEPAVQPG